MVEQVCGTPRATFLKVAETLCQASGPERTGVICYAVGWTQHTTGVQTIRAATILQSLLGNIGRPGGGILALRGHASIQGSTDIPTLYNLLPGYLNAPSALKNHDTLADYIETEISPTSYWYHFPKFIVSLLKAWFGDCGHQGERLRLRLAAPQRRRPLAPADVRCHVRRARSTGSWRWARTRPSAARTRRSSGGPWPSSTGWSSATCTRPRPPRFWKDSPEVKSGETKPEDIATEIFLLPAAATAEMDGTYTNTQRLIQWHDRAADPPGDARSDLWFTVHLGLRLKQLYAGSALERDRPIQGSDLGLHRPPKRTPNGESRTSPPRRSCSRR